jgi:DNA-binding IclR family transcriptional regulator
MAQRLIPRRQLEMPLELGRLALTRSQLACFEAIRRGIHSKSQIAIAAHLDLAETLRTLDALAKLRLIKRTADQRWRSTERGRNCEFRAIPDKKRRNSNKLGQGGKRLLETLRRPMSGSELARHLKITKQRVHQLVVKLHGMGHVRLGDGERVLHVIARKADPTPLLSRDEERVFSAVAEQYDTTTGKIRRAARCNQGRTEDSLKRLVRIGLVAENEKANGSKRYQISTAGSLHPQYRHSAERADPPPLAVRSDRVLSVLSHLAEHGCAQITEVRDALGIPHRSINALFQYLKRKSLVRKNGKELRSPYALTDEGREALTELHHRRAA